MKNIFSGVRRQWLPLYLTIKNMAEKALGPFEETENSRAVLWRRASCFAEFDARKDCLTAAFPAAAEHGEWNPVKVRQTSKNRVVHYFELYDDSRFAELIAFMREAFELAKGKKASSVPQKKSKPAGVDEYIAAFPPEQRDILSAMRKTLREAAPGALEKISWNMPTLYQGENLVHYAAMKRHLGFYPGADGIAAFQKEIAPYKSSKGCVQFPYDKPIPYELAARITRYRAAAAAKLPIRQDRKGWAGRP